MDNENDFNFSNDNSFKKVSYKQPSNGFGKNVFLPFISGVVGATLVVGTCFGVPSVKEKIINAKSYTTSTSAGTSSENPLNLINISDYSNTSIAVAEKVLPSVVGITVTYQVNSIFGATSGDATGSGIIISEDGYILTNNHVISSESSSSFYAISEATDIKVNIYNDKESYKATVVGTDAYTDLAVLKIDKTGLTPAVLGNSDESKVGEYVMAIGNPLGMDYSVTTGIISAINREVQSEGTTYLAIQTDAAINSGNSGGALVNANGEVIGINTLKLSGNGVEGIGFAIPISSTTSIINQLIEFKEVKRPYIGIAGSSVDETLTKKYNIPQGIYVDEIQKDSPAEKGGLQVGDIIIKIEDTEVKSVNELNRIKNTHNIGDKITLTIIRDNQEQKVEIILTETPAQTEEQPKNNQYVETQPNMSGSIFDLFR